MFPVPCSLFPAPCSLFPDPLFPNIQKFVPHLIEKCCNHDRRRRTKKYL
ncbi:MULTISPECIES: hypothetical protein [unclassified Moorena]|nr:MULTISPECIES: hypothetical protein [unclassified Moorena]NEO19436.1 hypothetical protein [Moorena sp. SIO4A5]NEQ58464.1 hypothetical protein [Moorena sp. SIO4A1]